MNRPATVDGTRPSNPRVFDLNLLLPALNAERWQLLDDAPPTILKCRTHGTGYVISRHTTMGELLRVLSHACCLSEDVGRPIKGYHRTGYANPARIPPGRPVDIRPHAKTADNI